MNAKSRRLARLELQIADSAAAERASELQGPPDNSTFWRLLLPDWSRTLRRQSDVSPALRRELVAALELNFALPPRLEGWARRWRSSGVRPHANDRELSEGRFALGIIEMKDGILVPGSRMLQLCDGSIAARRRDALRFCDRSSA